MSPLMAKYLMIVGEVHISLHPSLDFASSIVFKHAYKLIVTLFILNFSADFNQSSMRK